MLVSTTGIEHFISRFISSILGTEVHAPLSSRKTISNLEGQFESVVLKINSEILKPACWSYIICQFRAKPIDSKFVL